MNNSPYIPDPSGRSAGRKGTLDGRKTAKALFAIFAAASLCGTLYLCITHEPDNETVTFSADSDDDGEITAVKTSALTYLFQFTGDNADSVHFDFGDGTSADAFEVYKTYEEAGTYNIICKATNFLGTRYSGYQLTIEPKDYGLFGGYEDELLLLAFSILFMTLAYCIKADRAGEKNCTNLADKMNRTGSNDRRNL